MITRAEFLTGFETRRTARLRACHQLGAPAPTMRPACRASVEIAFVGKRPRAWQYALLLAARQTANDALDHRLVDRLLTTAIGPEYLRQSTCARNIDKVSVGGLVCDQGPFTMRRQQFLDPVE